MKTVNQGFTVSLRFRTMTYIRELAFQIVEQCVLNHKSNLEKKMAGYG
jgi:hypothetical protein